MQQSSQITPGRIAVKTQQQIEDRIRQIELVLVRAAQSVQGDLPACRKLKTEWLALCWVMGREELTINDLERLMLKGPAYDFNDPVYRRMDRPHRSKRNVRNIDIQ